MNYNFNYIIRNYEFDINDAKAFEIYSNLTCEHLEFICNYHDMIKIMQDNIDMMLDDELIDYRDGWNMREDYVAYNETVDLLENGED